MRKRVTTDLVEKYLEQHGWSNYRTAGEPGEQQGFVLTGWSSPLSDESHMLVIDPMVEKHAVHFRVKEIATAPPDATPADRLNGLLFALAALNHELIMGAFAFDPNDGELVFNLGIPVDSDNLRFEDFEHCIAAITSTVDRYAPGLRGIIDGTTSANDVIN